jgi:multidrug efflux pump
MLNATVTAQSRLQTPEQFANIVVKTQPDGARALSDVARVELGAENYGIVSRINGHPGAGIADQPGARRRRAEDRRAGQGRGRAQSRDFPPASPTPTRNDTTEFIKLSIEEVVKTLIEAIILVVIVMFVFLQSWRATLIPTIAVPVVLLGTFAVFAAPASRSTR